MLAVMMVRLLLSPSGAIDRSAFVAGLVVLAGAALGVDHAAHTWPQTAQLAPYLVAALFVWSALCLSRKRLHDFGWSGLMMLAFLGLYLLTATGAVLLVNREALNSWQTALAALSLFSMPMVGWLIALAIIPGHGMTVAPVRQP
jgi:uncharacterized membrane protein YhaH (DUF805 family)